MNILCLEFLASFRDIQGFDIRKYSILTKIRYITNFVNRNVKRSEKKIK